MNRLLGSLVFAISLVTPVSKALASVPISCAPGLAPVQSEGIQIAGGVIELLDNACQPNPGGLLPPALSVTNVAATPASVNAGQSVTYSANVANQIVVPVAGITYDSCNLDVIRPGGVVNSSTPVPTLTPVLNISVAIPPQAVSGVWQLALKCRRFVSGQEIVVPAIAAANVQVNSVIPPNDCDSMTLPFVNGETSTYDSHYGVPFSTNHTWIWDFTGNVYSATNQLQQVKVRSYSFIAPAAGQTKKINIPSSAAGVSATISLQCGNFNAAPACTGVASSAISWTTGAHANRCALVPGQTYYLNFAWFKMADYLANGTVVSTCECPGQNCSNAGPNNVSSCQFSNNSTNP
jgi:hypothetical protein